MQFLGWFILTFMLVGCASKKINYEKITPIKNKEFDRIVKIKVEEVKVENPPIEIKEPVPGTPVVPGKVSPPVAKPSPPTLPPSKILPKLPKLEDSEGFSGRRPIVDPYLVGERVVLEVKYMNIKAGTLTIETLPYAQVNGQKTYHFRARVKTSPSFEYFYAVDDMIETFLTYNTLLPLTHLVEIKETKKFGETRSYFDWSTNIARKWDSKFIEGKGRKDKKKEWKLEPYSQNIISALFYLRAFTLTPDKEIAYRVSDDGENFVFRGKVLRRELLSTSVGPLNTVVIKPEITLRGSLKPVGDIFIWLTDDDRKQIVQIQTKIKIGSIFGKVISM